MKKIILIIISIFLNFNILANSNIKELPNIKSESYILMDQLTGKVLAGKDINKVMSPASLTKVMTAYVVFREIEKGNISKNDFVNISKNAMLTARRTDSARTFLEVRDKVSLDEVLTGLLVQSGNDAAIALAEHISGTEEAFAKLMTTYANEELNMKNSKFHNASGLPIDNHYTTAFDMATLVKSIVDRFPKEYAYYFSMKGFSYNDIYQPNRNKLLFRNEYIDGVKTGWHTKAGYCYASSIFKNGRRLIMITFNAEEPEYRFDDALALADFGYKYFDNFELINSKTQIKGLSKIALYKSNKKFANIYPKNDIILTLNKSDKKYIKAKVEIEDYIIAPVLANTKVGKVSFFLKDDLIAETDLIIKENILLGDWKNILVDHIALNF
tara:strand:+ start:33074 stop:34228 length:1155 start_codon:yes stop_codon:yes gene_type:complete